jgi:ankyrin repeat protein
MNYETSIRLLAEGSIEELGEAKQHLQAFPHGLDKYVGRRWITNAIDCGSKLSIRWMLSEHVALRFRDDEGYTVLHSAIDRRFDDRHEVLRMLLQAGADVNALGINEWTPMHMAAARDDVAALAILIEYGADASLRTRIDDFATPLEEARTLGRTRAVSFLEETQ